VVIGTDCIGIVVNPTTYIIFKSHSMEEKEIKNLENLLSKQLTDFYQVSIHKSGPVVAMNVW
jgi:hypothetical protein